jgi:hypothetical protein
MLGGHMAALLSTAPSKPAGFDSMTASLRTMVDMYSVIDLVDSELDRIFICLLLLEHDAVQDRYLNHQTKWIMRPFFSSPLCCMRLHFSQHRVSTTHARRCLLELEYILTTEEASHLELAVEEKNVGKISNLL